MNYLEIKDLIGEEKARYLRYVDTKKWNEFEKLFSPNPILRFYDAEDKLLYEFTDKTEYVRTASSFLEGARSIHHIHNYELKLESEDTAHAIWSMEDLIYFPKKEGAMKSMHGFGHYYETWKKIEGKWLIDKLELRRTILNITN